MSLGGGGEKEDKVFQQKAIKKFETLRQFSMKEEWINRAGSGLNSTAI